MMDAIFKKLRFPGINVKHFLVNIFVSDSFYD
jgi:hypothetical protein